MRAAIVGCGNISAVHAKSISATEGARLAAVADCVPRKAEKTAAEYGARAYGDWREMIDREKPDIVHICTPHFLHASMAQYCLARGIHVFAEKPPVISGEQLADLRMQLERAEQDALRGGVSAPRMGVCFQNRWNPEVQAAKQLLKSGELGDIIGARGFVTWCRNEDYYADEWHGKKASEGGGALINQGIHTLDLIQFLLGERADGVSAVQANFHLRGVIEVEDTLCARIIYPRAAAVFYVTTGYAADASPLIEVQCAGGLLRIEDQILTIRRDGREPELCRFAQDENYGKKYWGAGHRTAISHFYESVREGVPDLLDFVNAEPTLELMLKIYEAADR